jgi:hypothetical protein
MNIQVGQLDDDKYIICCYNLFENFRRKIKDISFMWDNVILRVVNIITGVNLFIYEMCK